MKEKDILKLAQKELDAMGLLCWTAYKRTGFAQQDIFGIFDIVYLQHETNIVPGRTITGFIQCTTKHHLSDRRNKIRAYFREKKLPVPARVYVWAYDSEAARFIKELIQ